MIRWPFSSFRFLYPSYDQRVGRAGDQFRSALIALHYGNKKNNKSVFVREKLWGLAEIK
jgi:hypothetical protein